MPDSPPISVKPLEETYSEDYLNMIGSLPEHLEMGWHRDPPSELDWQYPDKVVSDIKGPLDLKEDHGLIRTYEQLENLPGIKSKFSRKQRTGPVTDQEMKPFCVCYSGGSVKTEHERKEHRRTYNAFEDEWYERCKEIDPWPNQDGTGIRYAATVGKKRGIYMDDPRTVKDDEYPRLFKFEAYVRLNSFEQIVEAIFRHGTVWFGITVDDGIFTPLDTSIGAVIPAPTGDGIGGHAMCFTGYDLTLGLLKVKNSWGNSWGDEGFAWMPISHLTTYSDYDAWLVADLKDIRV